MQAGPVRAVLIDFVVRGEREYLLLDMSSLRALFQVEQAQIVANVKELALDLKDRLAVLISHKKLLANSPCALFDVKLHRIPPCVFVVLFQAWRNCPSVTVRKSPIWSTLISGVKL